MGAVLGLLLGRRTAARLVVVLGARPRARARRAAPAAAAQRGRARRRAPGRLRRSSACVCAFVATVVVLVASRTLPVALVFGAMGGYLPVAVLKGRARRRQRELRRGVARGGRQPRHAPYAPGCRCPRRCPRWASADPSRCATAFRAFALDYQVSGRFSDCARPAQGAAVRPGRRPRRGEPARRSRGRRRRPRAAAAQPLRLPARRRPHPLRAASRARPGRSTAPAWRWRRRGWSCCCCASSPR